MFFLKDLPGRRMVERYAADYPNLDVDATLAALHAMREASLLIRRLESYFASHDLSQLRFLVLIVIDREPEREALSISEIIDRIDVSKPVMSRTLTKLEADGLIAIGSNDDDARLKTVRLTSSGGAKLANLLPGYYEILAGFKPGVHK